MSNITIQNVEVPILEVSGNRVVTLAMIDKVHQRPEGTARKRFNDNKERFIEGEDYFVRNSDEARRMGITAPNGLIILSESGYLMLVKSFTDDLAWEVQRKLVNTYFKVTNSTSSLASRKTRLINQRAPSILTKSKMCFGIAKEMVFMIPGLKPEIAAAHALEQIRLSTGEDVSQLMRALPSANLEQLATLNATEVGKHLDLKARGVNLILNALGMIYRDEQNEWRLTEAGTAFGEMKPFHRNGHTGYEIRWKESVVEMLMNHLSRSTAHSFED